MRAVMLLALALLAGTFLTAQAPAAKRTVDDRPVRVGIDLPLVEPHIAAHPQYPRRFVGGTMIAHPDGSYGCVALSTPDGESWRTHDLGMRTCADVWVAYLPDSSAVFSASRTTVPACTCIVRPTAAAPGTPVSSR